MSALRFSLIASFALISVACGGEPDGGLSSAGAEEMVCPLNAADRAEIERVVEDAHTDASWIATQSPGYKAPVARAFGAQVPFASLPSLFLVEVVEECSGVKQLAKQCPGEAKAAAGVCTQFACEEDGTMLADVSLEAVPAIVPASSGEGEVRISAFEHETRYKRSNDTDLAMKWSTRIELEPEEGRELAIKAIGKAEMSGGMLLAYHVDMDVKGYGAEDFTAVSDYDGTGLAGMGSVGDTPVVLFDTFGFSWIGPCTAGIGD
jgi:hypothetical protein